MIDPFIDYVYEFQTADSQLTPSRGKGRHRKPHPAPKIEFQYNSEKLLCQRPVHQKFQMKDVPPQFPQFPY
jgi:hypothetical protein